jgi:hypothetical protein
MYRYFGLQCRRLFSCSCVASAADLTAGCHHCQSGCPLPPPTRIQRLQKQYLLPGQRRRCSNRSGAPVVDGMAIRPHRRPRFQELVLACLRMSQLHDATPRPPFTLPSSPASSEASARRCTFTIQRLQTALSLATSLEAAARVRLLSSLRRRLSTPCAPSLL